MNQQDATAEAPLLLRAEEAAKLLSLGRTTVFAMLATGELPAVRVGRAVRVRRADLDKWIEERAAQGRPSAPKRDAPRRHRGTAPRAGRRAAGLPGRPGPAAPAGGPAAAAGGGAGRGPGGSVSLPAPVDGDADPAAEVGRDLRRALARFMDHAVRAWRAKLADVEKKQAGYVPPGERDELAGLRELTRYAVDAFERIGRDGAGRIEHLAPDELGWHDLSAEWARDEAAGGALWERVRRAAREELAVGTTGAEVVEGYHARPFERAAYLAVRDALADGLRPGNGAERLLVDGMAEAWTMRLLWLDKHAKTESLDAARVGRDIRERGEWQPPRLGEAEAVDRAAQMADRFERQFLRLLRAYRDQRRLLGPVIVTGGGQLNLGQNQVNLAEGLAGDGEGG